MVKQLLVDNIDFDSVPAGTIKIDCSGAYIANDHLIRGQYGLTQSSSPSPSESSESESEEESGPSASTSAVRLASQMVTCPSSDSVNAQNIALPQHNSDIIHMSVDIGGTLTKLVYFTSSSSDVDDPSNSGGSCTFRISRRAISKRKPSRI
ncbi:hypothetical protein CJJ09_004886 [Candidozyma auris]|nr:hypothetical protein CJJ09_004886 [[Candida] auris]